MELFDKRFVHFIWDDELKGKKCFMANGIDILRATVEKGCEFNLRSVVSSGNESAPFQSANGVYAWVFAYYDPNYEAKRAFNEGKIIQVRCSPVDTWTDCVVTPEWNDECEYREKPVEKNCRPYKDSAEMIADFIDRFKVKCPSCCKPLIWVRLKVDKMERLIVAYGDNFVEIGNKTKAVTLQHLFEQYEFLDESPVGMEMKE